MIRAFTARWLALVLLAATLPASAQQRHVLQHDGIEREYFVHVPDGPAKENLPLVVALHGYGNTVERFVSGYALNGHADDNGYIIVYPQGSRFEVAPAPDQSFTVTSWNDLAANIPVPEAGPHCTAESFRYPCPPECGECSACMWTSCYDDLGFIERVLDEMIAGYPVDPQRVYLVGVSNGGMMTLRLGCNLSGRFAAIAPIIGQLAPGHVCGPGADVPMLHLAGARDEVVRFDGKPGTADGFIYTSVAQTMATWAGALECDAGPDDWATAESAAAGLNCSAYAECRVPGHEVVSCIDPEGGHEWPGQTDGSGRGMDLVWSFFDRYRSAGPDSLE
ncbi:MAG: PHB depolymerase family esterase [Woeseiaceae bacterium]|nr:PHB depolymerase family esterase [Woeseiaceae bacterium]